MVRIGLHALTWLLLTGTFVDHVVGQQAAQQPPIQPGDVETEASRVFTYVQGTGVGHSHGMEARLTGGSLRLGARQNAGRFVIDMQSFDADTPLARKIVGLEGKTAGWMRKKVNKEMHGSKILDSQQYPTATFVIESALPVNAGPDAAPTNYELAGQLTIRNVTQPISVRASVEETDGWLNLKGRFSFDQSDFEIKPLSKGFGAMGVADQVTITGEIWIAPTKDSLASLRSTQQRR